ncbi:hypothetical protein BDY19DRAFT_996241 [Irpex rosettiformis]|uniref:Uncharacterized protein n=1 Tax=Irpex rosettiformis TaxID=378272 RepID=A0ACB8TVP3_9APHY|nr:hypothetical protein BDY19DRAFT_996241 [Irpex rosettiformis]
MSRHIPEHNQVTLNYYSLVQVLDDLAARLFHYFRTTVCLVIHGGAVMVLHKNLRCRQNTRDVDYIHRSFETEWKKRGVNDAGERLNTCIAATAAHFGLGLDWMNAHADVALPMAYDKYGRLYDPIYAEAMQPTNIMLNTVYESRGLRLVGVSWSWAVALKLVRYKKDDPEDIAAILKLGTQLKGLQWTRQIMEEWLLNMCSPMGYANYQQPQIDSTREKMRDAVKRAQALAWPSQPSSSQSLTASSVATVERPRTVHAEQSSGNQSLRHRTQSLSQHRPHSTSAISAASSAPSLAMPHAIRLMQPQLLTPHHTGNSQRTQVAMVPTQFSHLPPGFVPYYVATPPNVQPVQYHFPTSHRIRTPA